MSKPIDDPPSVDSDTAIWWYRGGSWQRIEWPANRQQLDVIVGRWLDEIHRRDDDRADEGTPS
jgi:hypothetical protein